MFFLIKSMVQLLYGTNIELNKYKLADIIVEIICSPPVLNKANKYQSEQIFHCVFALFSFCKRLSVIEHLEHIEREIVIF